MRTAHRAEWPEPTPKKSFTADVCRVNPQCDIYIYIYRSEESSHTATTTTTTVPRSRHENAVDPVGWIGRFRSYSANDDRPSLTEPSAAAMGRGPAAASVLRPREGRCGESPRKVKQYHDDDLIPVQGSLFSPDTSVIERERERESYFPMSSIQVAIFLGRFFFRKCHPPLGSTAALTRLRYSTPSQKNEI